MMYFSSSGLVALVAQLSIDGPGRLMGMPMIRGKIHEISIVKRSQIVLLSC